MICISLLVFAVVVDVVTDDARNGTLSEMLYADDLVLASDAIWGLRENCFQKWKQAFEGKGLKVNLWETKILVSETEGEISCRVCGKM